LDAPYDEQGPGDGNEQKRVVVFAGSFEDDVHEGTGSGSKRVEEDGCGLEPELRSDLGQGIGHHDPELWGAFRLENQDVPRESHDGIVNSPDLAQRPDGGDAN
jgi:hypothetical protein